MIKTVIIDDEPLAIELLTDYCREVSELDVVHCFQEAGAALTYLRKHPVDLVFLDIDMPQWNGLHIAEQLTPATRIIFVTAYREFGPEAFQLKAVDYLLKPVELTRFLEAVEKVMDFFERSESIIVRADRSDCKIRLSDIIVVQGIKDYVQIRGKEKSWLVKGSLGVFLRSYPMFVRVHKSYAVYPPNVDRISTNEMRIGEEAIPIGKQFKENCSKIFKIT